MSPLLRAESASTLRELQEIEVQAEKGRKTYVWKKGAFFNLFTLCAALLTALVLLNLSQRALIAEDALKLEKLRGLFQTEKIRQERLFLRTKKLNSPERIEKIALFELGMVTPSKIHYIILPPRISQGEIRSPDKKLVYQSPSRNLEKEPFSKPR